MESKELADILRKTADILDHFEEKKIDEALNVILQLIKKNNTPPNVPKPKKYDVENSEETIDYQKIITDFYQMSGEEINELLTNDKALKTKKALLALAKEMSLSTSVRQTKEVIKHSIIKYIERRKMDDLIRIEGNK